MAAKEGHGEIISILIEAGAQLEAKADLNVSGLWWVNALCMWRSLEDVFAYISGACSHEGHDSALLSSVVWNGSQGLWSHA